MKSTNGDLAIAIEAAKTDTREAPWYGVWNIILTQKLFNNFCKKPCSTITYPQFPLTSDVDTCEEVEDDEESEEEFEEKDIRIRPTGGDVGPLTPERSVPIQHHPIQYRPNRYHPPRHVRCSPIERKTDAPSPDTGGMSSDFLLSTPLQTPISTMKNATLIGGSPNISTRAQQNYRSAPQSIISSVLSSAPSSIMSNELTRVSASTVSRSPSVAIASAPHLSSPKKSTRIPDFVQLIFRPKAAEFPSFEKMIILLVEIKKRVPQGIPTLINQNSLLDQVHAQVYHAFSTDMSIHTLGIIIALGDAWTYQEYNRLTAWTNFIQEGPNPDLSYAPPGSQKQKTKAPIALTSAKVEAHFNNGYAVLGTSESDRALLALRQRLKELDRWK
ncbi:hypothetical protein BDZ94DRAFT_1325002 [Collybia nuda]|uniref:Uncharacterized protein n=1 Tax=Collybia nuda TaxID=64659 RepID=A0A9P5XYN5_9AGAR|nr:hypothetical protein BDZ94DRAFT_1325002 [Collybia nuda]